MSVYYFNGAKILAPFTITSNEPIYDVDTVSLSKQRASQGVQRWELSFNTLTQPDNEADMLVGIVSNIATATTMTMPQLPSVSANNTAGVNLGVLANATAGASSVDVTSNGDIVKGSFIKFSNHSKVYMVTETVGAGPVTINIFPKLRESLTTAHSMYTGDSVSFTYYRDIRSVRGITFIDGVLSNAGTIELVEAVI